MRRRKTYGVSFSWKRALGLSGMRQGISRRIGIPTTRQGLQRKAGSMLIKSILSIFSGKGRGQK